MKRAGIGHKTPFGLRTVALFEFVKGIAWLMGGVMCLQLMGTDVQDQLGKLFHFLHVDPAWGFAKLCIEYAARATDTRLLLGAGFAAICAVVRFVEAYGLWYERHWAEWFAALSAGLFLPVEIYHLWVRITLFKVSVFIINIIIVVYLVRLLMAEHRRRRSELVSQTQSQPQPTT